jgi:hypothetical protein
LYSKGDWKKKKLMDEDNRLTTEAAQEMELEEGIIK